MARDRFKVVGIAAALAIGAVASSAWANDEAAATILFTEGKTLMERGNYASACPKLEESQRLDPGIGTEFNLADCYEHLGRIATAWAKFLNVAASARRAADTTREAVAQGRARQLENRLSKLSIVAPKDVIGLRVRRNGELINGVLWGNPIPVDPGNYTIDASAPGKARWTRIVPVGPNAATVEVTVPVLEPGDGAGSSDDPALDAPRSSRRTYGLVLGGVGLAGIGVGSAFGLLAMSKHSDYEKLCSGNVCSAAGVAGHDDAAMAGTISTVAFVAGGALLAGGAAIFFTAPKATSSAIRLVPSVARSTGGMAVMGRW